MDEDDYESDWCRMMRSAGIAHVRAVEIFVANEPLCNGEEYEYACQQVDIDGSFSEVSVYDDRGLYL